MKKRITLLLVITFWVQLISCTNGKIKIGKSPFTPFPISTKPLQGISNPMKAWIFQIPYKSGDNMIGVEDKPVVDDSGNVYFISKNDKFYALNTVGEELWKINDTRFENIKSLKDGFVVDSLVSSNYYDPFGKFKQSFNNLGFYIGTDRMRYHTVFIKNAKRWWKALNEKKWWKLFALSADTGIASSDYNGKIRWVYPIRQIGEEIRSLEKCFFDQQSNSYFILRKYDEHEFPEDQNTQTFEIYSFTSDGKLRWNKEIPCLLLNGELIGNFLDFLPEQIVVEDRFLLEVSRISVDGKKEEGHIKCFSTDGIELWDYPLPKNKFIRQSYIKLDNSLFVVPLIDLSNNRTYVQALDQNGKLVWERDMISSESTTPIKDMDDNIYIGVGGTDDTERYIYSFDKLGKTRWSMKQPNSDASFDTPLVLGPNQQIYYGCNYESVLYCIGNKP
jgi:hypothetical protein